MSSDFDVVSLNKQAWERIAKKYENKPILKVSGLFDHFCDNLPIGAHVLDVGSGTGLPYARSLVERGFKVLGVDVSLRMVRIAQKNVPQAEFKELSMTELNFENMFDGVLSSFSMLLLDPPLFRDVARRIVLSLKKGGVFLLILNEPSEEGGDADGEAIVEIMGETMYSRAYTSDEVLAAFIPLGMKQLRFQKEIRVSEEFGKEHVMEFLFKKT